MRLRRTNGTGRNALQRVRTWLFDRPSFVRPAPTPLKTAYGWFSGSPSRAEAHRASISAFLVAKVCCPYSEKDSHHVKMRISESCTTHVPQAALSLGEVRLIILRQLLPKHRYGQSVVTFRLHMIQPRTRHQALRPLSWCPSRVLPIRGRWIGACFRLVLATPRCL